jgi:hypothetical protein
MMHDRFGEKPGRAPSPEDVEFAQLLEVAYEKAEAFMNTEAIDMRAFKGIYNEAEIREDEMKVANYKRMFAAADTTEQQRRDKMLATVVEALLFDQGSRNSWMGSEAKVSRACELDDFAHGVDGFAEYQRKGMAAFLAMAIDATWSSNSFSKFTKIQDGLSRGKLSKLKYPVSGGKPQRGREVPRVVVGASEKTLREIIKLWVNGDDEALKNHPIQILFMQEIVDQLKSFQEFSKDKGHAKNVQVFKEYLEILEPILEEKRRTLQLTETYENDTVRNGIKASLFALNYKRPIAA